MKNELRAVKCMNETERVRGGGDAAGGINLRVQYDLHYMPLQASSSCSVELRALLALKSKSAVDLQGSRIGRDWTGQEEEEEVMENRPLDLCHI